MKKVLIVDDEPLARSLVRSYLQNESDIEIIAEATNGFEAAKLIADHKPDLVFLDIQMPKITGFEMLEIIDENPDVIFTTAYDEYAIKAFEVSAIDYLLKPFSRERFLQALNKWREQSADYSSNQLKEHSFSNPEEQSRIVIKDNGEIKIISLSDVSHIEAYDDYVKIHTQDKTYLKHQTMSYYEKYLPSSDFIRVHRSFIINLHKLTRIVPFEKNSYRAILTDESQIPISRNSYSKVKGALGL